MKSAGTDLRALVQQLVEGMLAHRAFGAPQHRRGGVVDRAALAVDALAVRLHLELLQVRGQQAQRVRVGQHRVRRRAEEVRVPHADQRHQRRHVLLERRFGEMAVDLVPPRAGTPRTPCQPIAHSRGEAHRRPHREAPADPVPHRQDLARAECLGGFGVRGDRRRRPWRPSWRARSALAIVSCVVKVFETTTNSVLAGSAPSSARSRSRGSTLAAKRTSSAPSPSASATRRGPRSEPPVPRLTMRVKRFSFLRSSRPAAFMRPSVSFTSCGAASPARSAVCQAARFSVVLIALPASSASRHSAKPRSAARWVSRRSVIAPRRWRE